MAPKTSPKSKPETAAAPELWCAVVVDDNGELCFGDDAPFFDDSRESLITLLPQSFSDGALVRVFRLIADADFEIAITAKRKGA